jgi:hypothetical protein
LRVATTHEGDPLSWAERHFGDLDLGDLRRNQRAVTIAAAMASKPGASIPQMFSNSYDIKASYNFFRHPEATPENLQQAHSEAVIDRMHSRPGQYLLLEDTTEMSWSGNAPVKGLGPSGTGRSGEQGFHLHSILAIGWHGGRDGDSGGEQEWPGRQAVEVLGLATQHYHVREPRPKGEPAKNNSKILKNRKRESEWWQKAGEAIGHAPEKKKIQWTRVCDRGADIYEQLISCAALNHRFVIRAAQDRCLSDSQGRKITGKLFEVAREQPALGRFSLQLRTRGTGQRRQPARKAELQVSVADVWLRAPQRPGKRPGSLPAIRCRVVRVWEVEGKVKARKQPPQQRLEWILLTDWEATTYDEALEVALVYSTRWLIEEFHKAIKTGTRAEQLQLERAESLFAAIAIKSVVALRLLDLRERVQVDEEAAAEESGLSELELAVLRQRLNRPIKTVREVALAIGRLGGHMNRKNDGMPGWQTLFLGMTQLNLLVQGARIALKMKKFG